MRTFGYGLLAGLALVVSAQAQIVTNGGFETGDLTGWTSSSGADLAWTINTAISGNGSYHGPFAGTYFVSTGCVGSPCIGSDALSSTNYLYEDLNTIVGHTYSVSFAFASGGNNSPMELLATFGGVTVEDLVNLPQSVGYTTYSQSVTATSTTSRVEFQGRQDPGYDALDGISVTDLGGSTPEPSTAFLGLGASLLGLTALRRRRAR